MADGKSVECAAPELLCNHTTKSAFHDDGDFVDPFIRLMIEREKEYLPKTDYIRKLRSGELDMSVRRDAYEWISKVKFIFWSVFLFNQIGFWFFMSPFL